MGVRDGDCGCRAGDQPFDEPNVSEAKEETKALAAHAASGRFDKGHPIVGESVSVFSRSFAGSSPAAVVRAAIDSIRGGDYVAFPSYLSASQEVEAAVREARACIRARTRAATTFGVGPGYLHSTGRYHKGGPNTLVAFVLTADDEMETPMPEAGYSFSILKRAQALGDIESLQAHGRHIVRIHFTSAAAATVDLERIFASGWRSIPPGGMRPWSR
jgi:transaldolase/glucose-6-phosphate isomerase